MMVTGEKHLLIAPNSEHSLATGIPEVLDCLGTTIRSIAAGNTNRPNFDYKYNETDGSITVTIPEGMAHGKVGAMHGGERKAWAASRARCHPHQLQVQGESNALQSLHFLHA